MVCTHYKSEEFSMRFCTRRIMGKENTAWDFFFGFDFSLTLFSSMFRTTPLSAYGQEPVCGQHLLHPPDPRPHPSLLITSILLHRRRAAVIL